MRPWGPDRGSLSAVEHAELDHGEVGGARHDAAERIDFAHDRPLGNAPDRGVAGHLPDGLERAGHQSDAAAEARGGNRRLGSGVAGPDDDHVEA